MYFCIFNPLELIRTELNGQNASLEAIFLASTLEKESSGVRTPELQNC
jgi:hypothetical protein